MPSTSNLNAKLAASPSPFGSDRDLSAPFLGQLRAYLRAAFPGQFVTIVGASVALAMAGAFGLALARIRHARATRYAVIARIGRSRGRLYPGHPDRHSRSGRRRARPLHRVRRHRVPLLHGVPAARRPGHVHRCRFSRRSSSARSTSGCSGSSRTASARPATCSSTSSPSPAGWRSAQRSSRRAGSASSCGRAPRRVAAVVGAGFILVFAGFVNAVHLGHVVHDGDDGLRVALQRR